MPTIRAIAGALGILSLLVTGSLSTGCNRSKEPSTGDKVAAAAASRIDRARKERTLGKLEALRTVLTRYAIDHEGAMPEGSSLAGISAELAPRYMPMLEAEDGWGNIMSYASDGKSYSIVSSGADGVSGTADDI